MDGGDAGAESGQAIEAGLDDLNAMAQIREPHGGHEADIAGPDNDDPMWLFDHDLERTSRMGPARWPLPGSACHTQPS